MFLSITHSTKIDLPTLCLELFNEVNKASALMELTVYNDEVICHQAVVENTVNGNCAYVPSGAHFSPVL